MINRNLHAKDGMEKHIKINDSLTFLVSCIIRKVKEEMEHCTLDLEASQFCEDETENYKTDFAPSNSDKLSVFSK